MRKILKVTSVLGAATAVSMLSGLVRAKFLAWQLGPAGVGLVGQAMMYSAFAIQFCSLNINTGITKEISESLANNDEPKAARIVTTATTLQFMASLLLIVVALFFSGWFSSFLFSESKYWIYFVGITIAASLMVTMTGMAYPIFYGFRKVAECTKLAVSYTLIGLGIMLVLVYFYKTEGMLAQIIVAGAVAFALSRYLIMKNTPVQPRVDLGFVRDKDFRAISSRLFKYGMISFIPSNVNMFVMLYLRGLFMRRYGIEANGFFQVGYALSAYYLPFVTNSVWGHFYPEMCSLKEDRDVNRELNQFIRFAIFVSVAIAAGCVVFRKYIILTLFSGEFIKACDLLTVQAIGDIFFVISYIFATSLAARRRFRDVMTLSMVAYNGVLLLVYYVLSKYVSCGLLGLNVAIACANMALTAVAIVYWRFDTGFVLSSANIGLIAKSTALIAAVLLIPDTGIVMTAAKTVLAGLWLAVSVTRDEARSVIRVLSSKFNRVAADENG